jgi:zinc transport system permease protein
MGLCLYPAEKKTMPEFVGFSILTEAWVRLPFITGLALSLLLPLLGCYLRLRNEWLAALGLAQASAASGLIGFTLGMPLLLASGVGALAMAALKFRLKGDNSHYALMMLLGWSVTLLVAANAPVGESLGHVLTDGQLYFTGRAHLFTSVTVLLAGAGLLLMWSKGLLRDCFFPYARQVSGDAQGLGRYRLLGFDCLIALAMALAMTSMGLMAAFAMVFIPAWLVFPLAPSWRMTLVLACGFNVLVYLLSFVLALVFDQPFGPLMVVVSMVLALLVLPLIRLITAARSVFLLPLRR